MAVFNKMFAPLRTAFCLLAFFAGFGGFAAGGAVFALFSFSFPSLASAQEPVYTVRGVEVDVTAGNAVQARSDALGQAQMQAFQILAQRLLSRGEFENFILPDLSEIAAYVQDFEVTDEQLSAVRYKGTYTIRFRPDQIRRLFTAGGLTYTDVVRKPLMILPVYQHGARLILWEEDNPWLAAWSRGGSGTALVPVSIPIGDLQDVSALTGADALTYDPARLTAMRSRYGASDAVLGIAAPVSTGPGGLNRDLQVTLYDVNGPKPRFITSFRAEGDLDTLGDALFDGAVQKVMDVLSEDWKVKAETQTVSARIYRLAVHYGSLPEWVSMRKKLESLPEVKEVHVEGLKPKIADVTLTYDGEADRFIRLLTSADFAVDAPPVGKRGGGVAGPGAAVFDGRSGGHAYPDSRFESSQYPRPNSGGFTQLNESSQLNGSYHIGGPYHIRLAPPSGLPAEIRESDGAGESGGPARNIDQNEYQNEYWNEYRNEYRNENPDQQGADQQGNIYQDGNIYRGENVY